MSTTSTPEPPRVKPEFLDAVKERLGQSESPAGAFIRDLDARGGVLETIDPNDPQDRLSPEVIGFVDRAMTPASRVESEDHA